MNSTGKTEREKVPNTVLSYFVALHKLVEKFFEFQFQLVIFLFCL